MFGSILFRRLLFGNETLPWLILLVQGMHVQESGMDPVAWRGALGLRGRNALLCGCGQGPFVAFLVASGRGSFFGRGQESGRMG